MEEKFIYINEYGKQDIFLRKQYYDQICALVTDFFEEELVDNEFHKHFVLLLNSLEDYNDVYILTTEMNFYWAICIIENEWTNNHLIKGKTLDDYKSWRLKYYKDKGVIGNAIIKGINEETYIFTDEENHKSIFLREMYYNYICALVTDFFDKPLEYNLINFKLINYLNALFADGNYEGVNEITGKPPYYWAMSIIENEWTTRTLSKEELEKHYIFQEEFYKKHNINSFIHRA